MFNQSIAAFKTLVNSPVAKPTYNSYGTKHSGSVDQFHFAFYAVLRGKSLTSVTHDPNSERFILIKKALKEVATTGKSVNYSYVYASKQGNYPSYGYIHFTLNFIANSFNLSEEDILLVLRENIAQFN